MLFSLASFIRFFFFISFFFRFFLFYLNNCFMGVISLGVSHWHLFLVIELFFSSVGGCIFMRG